MKFLFVLAALLAYVALSQQQDASPDATTLPSSELEASTEKPERRPFVRLFPPFDRLFVPFEPFEPEEDVEFEKVGGPFEYQFNDRFSVEPYLTFPPNAGGGLTFRYRF